MKAARRVCELTEPLGLTQPTISHHLKVLVNAGIFTRDKRAVWAYYALVPAALNALSAVLSPPAERGRPRELASVPDDRYGYRRFFRPPDGGFWRRLPGWLWRLLAGGL